MKSKSTPNTWSAYLKTPRPLYATITSRLTGSNEINGVASNFGAAGLRHFDNDIEQSTAKWMPAMAISRHHPSSRHRYQNAVHRASIWCRGRLFGARPVLTYYSPFDASRSNGFDRAAIISKNFTLHSDILLFQSGDIMSRASWLTAISASNAADTSVYAC